MREFRSFSEHSTKLLAIQLRLFAFLQLVSGVSFISLACVLIWPPQGSALAVCLWLVGALAIIAGIVGFIASSEKSIACCLSPYVTLTGLVLAIETGLLLYLFIAPGKAVDSVIQAYTKGHENDPFPPTPPVDKIHSGIYIGRWVLLSVFALQLFAVFLAVLLRCCAKRAAKQQNNKYQPFVEDLESCYNARVLESSAKLAQMKADIVAAKTLKKNKAAAYLHTEMVSTIPAAAAASQQNNSQDTIAPYRPARPASLPPLPPQGVSRGGATTSTRVAGMNTRAGQPQRSPLGPSSLPSHATGTASAPAVSAQTMSAQSTSTTGDAFKATWASRASGKH
jgi:hypothetical protein